MYCSCYGRHTCTLVHLVLVGNWGMDIRHYGQSSFTTGAYLHTCIGPVSITNIQTLYLTLFFSSFFFFKKWQQDVFIAWCNLCQTTLNYWRQQTNKMMGQCSATPCESYHQITTTPHLTIRYLWLSSSILSFFSSNDKSSFDFVSLKHRYSSSKIHISIQRLNIHKLGKVPDVQFCICCFSQNK